MQTIKSKDFNPRFKIRFFTCQENLLVPATSLIVFTCKLCLNFKSAFASKLANMLSIFPELKPD